MSTVTNVRGRALGLVPSRLRARATQDLAQLVMTVVITVVVAYFVLVPVITMIVASLHAGFLTTSSHWTVSNYSQVLGSASFWETAKNSVIYGVAVALVSTTIGFSLAWLVVRTNTPGRLFASAVALIPLVIPGILNTVAWALLLSPHAGALNDAFNAIGIPSFNVYSMPGMVLVQSTQAVPIAFLIGVAAFRATDGSLEEAAMASGASLRTVLRKVTLPVVRPAILSAALLVFMQAIASFEVPQLIGVPGRTFVLVSQIYLALQQFPPDYGSVGVVGVVTLVIALTALVASLRLSRGAAQTVTGKGFRPTVQDIGRWRWMGLVVYVAFFVVVVVLPLAMLVWSSLLPSYEAPSVAALHSVSLANYGHIAGTPTLLNSLKNSFFTAVVTGAIVTVLCSLIAYITVKTRIPGRKLLDGLASTPIAVPSIVMGVGILYFYLAAPLPVHLYGTYAILIVAFVTIAMPYGIRYMTAGFIQINDELAEAATASGASRMQALLRIYAPLLVSSMVATFLYSMIISFREVSAAVFLYSQSTQVVAITIFSLWSAGVYPVVAALGVVMVGILALMVAIVLGVGKYLNHSMYKAGVRT